MPLKRNMRLLLLPILFLMLAACGLEEFSGEVFLTSERGQNIPVGGATIVFINEKEVVPYFSTFRDRRANFFLMVKVANEKLKAELLSSEELISRYASLRSKVEEAKIRLIQSAFMDKDGSVIFEREGGYSVDRIDLFVRLIISNPELATKPYVKETTKLLDELAVLEAEKEAILKKLEVSVSNGKDLLGEMAVEFVSVITEINKLSAIRDNKLAVHKVKTDTQGKFNISLPKGSYWAFSVEGLTSPSGKLTSDRLWALKIDLPKDKYIQFTNRNAGLSKFAELLDMQVYN